MFLLLNDGTVINEGRAGLSDGFLWLWLPGWTMRRVAEKVEEGAMSRIVWKTSEDDEEVYTGYTVCMHMEQENGRIAVCLVKG